MTVHSVFRHFRCSTLPIASLLLVSVSFSAFVSKAAAQDTVKKELVNQELAIQEAIPQKAISQEAVAQKANSNELQSNQSSSIQKQTKQSSNDEWADFGTFDAADNGDVSEEQQKASETNDEFSDAFSSDWGDASWSSESDTNDVPSLSGFAEIAIGNRFSSDPALDTRSTLRDARIQLRSDYKLSTSSFSGKVDFWYDGVKSQWESQVRELAWQGSLSSVFSGADADGPTWAQAFDLKIGRQVLTWGTGDYVFLNDLFPKDYQSFFAGRDDEYLKAPSTAVKLSGYFDIANIDLVYMPEFEPDIGITGEVFSFYNPQAKQNVAPAFAVSDQNRPNNSELALRIYRNIAGVEFAAYGYKGFTKQPTAFDESGQPRYSKMNAFGASAVTPLGKGIANAEYVFYNSIEDVDGTNPFIANDQSRFLLGYSQELVPNVMGGVQWYTEYTHDSEGLDRIFDTVESVQEKYRHWVTTRLTWMALRQTLTLNGFLFYSPSDDDGYLKATVTYSPTDKWQIRGGLNLFKGNQPFTFWGQFEDASNAYVAYRYFF